MDCNCEDNKYVIIKCLKCGQFVYKIMSDADKKKYKIAMIKDKIHNHRIDYTILKMELENE